MSRVWMFVMAVAGLILIGLGVGQCSHARAETGTASWYGGGERLRKHTASGERFNTHAMTAAHRTLSFGTRVEIINLRNGRVAIVRINDRGPHRRTRRIIDVTSAVASRLGFRRAGTTKVRITVLSKLGAKSATQLAEELNVAIEKAR